MIRKLRELAFRAVEWVRSEYRYHERQLAEASIELEKRGGWEWWGDSIALWVALLLPTFVLLSPACDRGAAPPPSPPAERRAPESAVRTRAQYGVQRAVADTLAGFLEAYLNGNARAARMYLSETCRPEDVEEIAWGTEVMRQINDAFGYGEHLVEVDESLLTVTHSGPDRVTAVMPFEDAVHISVNGEPVPPQALFGEIGTGSVEFRREGSLWTLTECNLMASGMRDIRRMFEDWLNDR